MKRVKRGRVETTDMLFVAVETTVMMYESVEAMDEISWIAGE